MKTIASNNRGWFWETLNSTLFKHIINPPIFLLNWRLNNNTFAILLFEEEKVSTISFTHHSHTNGSIPLLQVSKHNRTEQSKLKIEICLQQTLKNYIDKTTVMPKNKESHLPVSTASASLVFQCLAMFSERGSSGFGALRSAWMLVKINTNVNAVINNTYQITYMFRYPIIPLVVFNWLRKISQKHWTLLTLYVLS